jgi:hypothetical protein
MKVLANGDGLAPLPRYDYEPSLFPQAEGPAVVAQEGSSTIVDNFDNLLELISILGSSLAESSPLALILGVVYAYTRFVQGKPVLKRKG